jgi:hypothetical protein
MAQLFRYQGSRGDRHGRPKYAFFPRDGAVGARFLPSSPMHGQVVLGHGGPQQQTHTKAGCWTREGSPLPVLTGGSPVKITRWQSSEELRPCRR